MVSAILPLAEMDIVAGLTEDDISCLDGAFSEVAYAPGDLIIREGDASDALYMLAAGSATVRVTLPGGGRHKRLGAIGRGVTFGEIALFDGGPRTAGQSAVMHVLPRAKPYSERAPVPGQIDPARVECVRCVRRPNSPLVRHDVVLQRSRALHLSTVDHDKVKAVNGCPHPPSLRRGRARPASEATR